MPRITPLHWKEFERFILFVGCTFERQRGDHRIYWRSDLKRPVVFPEDDQIPVFIIKNNLRVLDIRPSEYIEILQQL